jgi:hypothetical protein
MVGDLTEKIQSEQSKFEKLIGKIPGYSGYKKKEQRREADKLLRLHVAKKYEEQLNKLNQIQYDLTLQGRLRVLVALERASMKLQLLIDRIKTASYGYSGWFDAVRVQEDDLSKLYDFDEAMLASVDTLAGVLAQLAEKGQTEEPTAEANQLISTLESLNATFSQRQDVLIS